MTKRPKEVYGKKLIYRYSAPVIFTLLMSLLTIGIFVVTLLLPYMKAEGLNGLKGLDLVYYGIYMFFPQVGGVVEEGANLVTSYINNIVEAVFAKNALVGSAIQIGVTISVIEMAIVAIYMVILLIASIVMIVSGRLKHWKLPSNCINAYFWFGLFFFYSAVIALNIYSALINKGPYYDGLIPYLCLGGLLVLDIASFIVYRKAFRDHVYVKNERTLNMYIEEYEKENMVVDTTNPDEEAIIEAAPKIVMTPLEDQKEKNESSEYRKKLPRGVKHIGGHAFSQNTALEEADIPLGIEVLGAGAFANCVNLKVVHIPESVKKIEYNCFFNCIRLERITYGGSREMWKRVKRGSNWLTAAGTKFVVCRDGALAVNPEK